jgi:hypothetical protein
MAAPRLCSFPADLLRAVGPIKTADASKWLNFHLNAEKAEKAEKHGAFLFEETMWKDRSATHCRGKCVCGKCGNADSADEQKLYAGDRASLFEEPPQRLQESHWDWFHRGYGELVLRS